MAKWYESEREPLTFEDVGIHIPTPYDDELADAALMEAWRTDATGKAQAKLDKEARESHAWAEAIRSLERDGWSSNEAANLLRTEAGLHRATQIARDELERVAPSGSKVVWDVEMKTFVRDPARSGVTAATIGAQPWAATSLRAKETKASPVAIAVEPQGDAIGHFTGVASPIGGQPDLTGDVVEPGAYTATLAAAKANGRPYLWPLLYSHDPARLIGGVTYAAERAGGLYIEGQIDLDTAQGQEAYSLMRNGMLSGLSIGYVTVKDHYVGKVRHLDQLDLMEISVVAIPAADAARVSSVGR